MFLFKYRRPDGRQRSSVRLAFSLVVFFLLGSSAGLALAQDLLDKASSDATAYSLRTSFDATQSAIFHPPISSLASEPSPFSMLPVAIAAPQVTLGEPPTDAQARIEPVLANDFGEADNIQQLQTRIAALEKALAETQEADTKQKDKERSAWEKAEKDKADVPLDKWNVKLGGHIQMDYINWANADSAIIGDENYFNYRRLRLVADGVGYGVFDFRLQMTLEPGLGSHEDQFASPDVKDAYLSMNEIPGIGRVRIGNFFVPFSLEQVTNDTNNIFNERSIPSQGVFAPDREVGIAFYNSSEDYQTSWAGGLFFDDINDTFKTRIDHNQGLKASGRVNWLPYYDAPSSGRYLIHTGIGVLHTEDYDDRVRFRSRPQIQRGPVLIDSGDLAADSYTTGNLELAIVWGQVTLQSEAFLSTVNLLSEPNVTVGGAYAHLSWFITGENRVYERFGQHGAQFGRNKPLTNFSASSSGIGWGAWEVKARWSNLNLTDVGAGQYNDFTTGFNWYWSDRTRIMFDWIHPFTSSHTVFGATESDLLAMRFDVNW